MNPEDLLGQQPPDALDPSMMQEEIPQVVEEVNKPDNSLSEQKNVTSFRKLYVGSVLHRMVWMTIINDGH
jgi:hypothetical protein